MDIFTFPLRFRSKTLWSDPAKKIQTLESFSQTEIDAGESILRALKYVNNPHLREHLKRHAKDELQHGELFRKRAQELRKHRPSIASISNKPDRLYNLSRGNVDAELNSHGFFTSDHFEKLGEIMYVAMLNIAEKKAEKSFSIHRDLIRNDLKTYAIFEKKSLKMNAIMFLIPVNFFSNGGKRVAQNRLMRRFHLPMDHDF